MTMADSDLRFADYLFKSFRVPEVQPRGGSGLCGGLFGRRRWGRGTATGTATGTCVLQLLYPAAGPPGVTILHFLGYAVFSAGYLVHVAICSGTGPPCATASCAARRACPGSAKHWVAPWTAAGCSHPVKAFGPV
jgi:hypothetical protein